MKRLIGLTAALVALSACATDDAMPAPTVTGDEAAAVVAMTLCEGNLRCAPGEFERQFGDAAGCIVIVAGRIAPPGTIGDLPVEEVAACVDAIRPLALACGVGSLPEECLGVWGVR